MTISTPLLHPVALAIVVAAVSGPVAAQQPDIDLEIRRGVAKVAIAVPEPVAARGAGDVAGEIWRTLRDDLEFTGLFQLIDPHLYGNVPATTPPLHDDWLAIGADTVVLTEASVAAGRIDLKAYLYDNESKTRLFATRYGGGTDIARRVAHQLADDLVKHFTGKPGIALTSIAFVSRHGEGKEIYLMDYDGARVRRVTTSGTLNLGPVWAPSGDELAFVSWRGRQPAVYSMNREGKLLPLGTLGGELSSAPDWSKDGRRLVYSSNYHGNTEIYILDRGTGQNRRLTHNPAIDTSPAFSPNGREIAFTTDRGGSPQIHVMDAEGLNARRVSWDGDYADSAAWSPDGSQLAFSTRIDGRFEVVVLDVASGKTTRLTRGQGHNEDPRWSPDGRHLVFSSSREGAYQVFTMRADGSNPRKLTRGPESYTPDWSPR